MNKKALETLEKCFRTIEGDVDAASMALKLDHFVLKGDVKWQMKVGVSDKCLIPFISSKLSTHTLTRMSAS
jgi:hypothetical protein